MDKVRKALVAAIIVASSSLLSAGAASASPPEPHHQNPAATSAAPPSQPGQSHTRQQPDHHDSLTGFPRPDHREERLEDDEYQIMNAAPPTLGRFDADTHT
jgi:Spy/CpxP family protein refolding chaperone